jgi:hypothetical protein
MNSPTVTLKEQIAKHLEAKGTLSGDDLVQIAGINAEAKPADPQAAGPSSPTGDTTVKVGPEAKDTAMKIADTDFAIDLMIHNDLIPEAESPADPLGLVRGTLKEVDVETVTITASDKLKFQDCMVDNGRFTKTFTMFNGKVTGEFRARKSSETRAILLEVNRLVEKNKLSVMEHATKLRHALLHFQLSELNGLIRPEVASPLRSVETFDISDSKIKIIPPVWLSHMDVAFDNMSEGLANALYSELRRFEKVYWAMVNSAKDQNFWKPEDSIIG